MPVEMIVPLLIECGVCIVCLCLDKKKESYVLMLVMMWIIMVSVTDSYDINNYRFGYENNLLIGKEPLFDAIQIAFYSTGASFEIFRITWETVMLVLLFFGIKKYTEYYGLALVLFFILPFSGFTTQLRSSMAAAILIVGFYLLLRREKWDLLKYAVVVFFASLIHRMALFYLLLLIPCLTKLDAKRWKIIMYIVSFVATIVVFLCIEFMGQIIGAISEHVNSAYVNELMGRIYDYFQPEKRSNFTGFSFNTCRHLISYGVTAFMCSELERNSSQSSFYSKQALQVVKKINATMLILIPLYAVSMQFDRFLNYFLPLCYGVIAQGYMESKKLGVDRRKCQIALALLLSCNVFVHMVEILAVA